MSSRGSGFEALRDLAETATPGPWEAHVLGSEGYVVREPHRGPPQRPKRIGRFGHEDWDTDKANAQYIAAVSPDVVLALLAEVERLRKIEQAVERFVKYADEYPEDISGPLRDDFLPQLRTRSVIRGREAGSDG